MRRAALVLAVTSLLFSVGTGASAARPPIKHVWIIVLENQDYETTFAANSPIPYLSKTLAGQGELLTHYYGIGHESLDNYIAMVSGQPPNPVTQSDCQIYQDFVGSVGSDGVAVGQGCVYPAEVKTLADQLDAKKLRWKGYMEDMGTPCRHPELNMHDETQQASASNQYAARHNPFVYFHSIIDRPACAQNVLDLNTLPGDLASKSSTPAYSFITPDLCSDGHDSPCADGRPGGLKSAGDFLQEWVPKITGSPAYADGGLLIVTFDEADTDGSDCCREPMGPNTPNNAGPMPGNGGGRIGAVLLSRYIRGGSVNDTPYNHYSLLRSMEDMFGLSHLAYAANAGLKPFEEDVFNNPSGKAQSGGSPPKVTLRGVPRRCVRRAFTARIGIRSNKLPKVEVRRDSRLIASRKSKSFHVRVGVSGLRAGKHALAVRARDAKNRSGRKTARFRVCR